MRGMQRRRSTQGAGRWSPRAAALAVVVALGGCASQTAGGPPVIVPGGDDGESGPGPQGDNEGDSLGELKTRLKRLRGQQVELASASDGTFGTCEDLCSLASGICSVTEKLCEVADRHPGEEGYQGLCRKAELECNEAEESCVDCVEQRQQSGATRSDAP